MRVRESQDLTDRKCLALRRARLAPHDIALELHVSLRRVHYGIDRARLAEAPRGPSATDPPAVPMFPIDAFTPTSACPHHGPIRKGSSFVCMVCHQSGRETHPALRRSAATDPAPEPKPKAKAKGKPSTRKQRRASH